MIIEVRLQYVAASVFLVLSFLQTPPLFASPSLNVRENDFVSPFLHMCGKH